MEVKENIQLSLSIEEVCRMTGICRTKLYQKINSGELRARKLDKKTLILKTDLDIFLSALAAYPSKSKK